MNHIAIANPEKNRDMDIEEDCFHETSFTDQHGQLRTIRVPVVQELARQGLKSLPQRYIRVEPPAGLAASPLLVDVVSTETHSLPWINMDKLRGGSGIEGRAQELAQLASGVKEWGMFLIKDHGILPCTLQDVKDAVKGFFGLSFAEKKASVGSYRSVDNMGYGRGFVKSDDQKLDWIDRLNMKAAPKGSTDGLCVWPQKPSNFRQIMEKYTEEAKNVVNELVVALAEALSLESHVFLKYMEPEDSEINVRVNYYPPCPRPDLALGIGPHSDASVLTFLMQFDATARGLQVLKDMKNWVPVPWPNDALLVSVGDFLEIMSNGRVKSPWHRVVTHMELERFSVALFYNPPSRAAIEPVGDAAASSEKGYKKVVVGDYLQNYYKISPTVGIKEAINFAKA